MWEVSSAAEIGWAVERTLLGRLCRKSIGRINQLLDWPAGFLYCWIFGQDEAKNERKRTCLRLLPHHRSFSLSEVCRESAPVDLQRKWHRKKLAVAWSFDPFRYFFRINCNYYDYDPSYDHCYNYYYRISLSSSVLVLPLLIPLLLSRYSWFSIKELIHWWQSSFLKYVIDKIWSIYQIQDENALHSLGSYMHIRFIVVTCG